VVVMFVAVRLVEVERSALSEAVWVAVPELIPLDHRWEIIDPHPAELEYDAVIVIDDAAVVAMAV